MLRCICPLTALIVWLVVVPSIACEYTADDFNHDLESRVEQQPVVFIGTVIRADETKAEFAIEFGYRGVPSGRFHKSTFEIPNGHELDCKIEFRQGERWLYAGRSIASGSFRLHPRGTGTAIEPDIEPGEGLRLFNRRKFEASLVPEEAILLKKIRACLPLKFTPGPNVSSNMDTTSLQILTPLPESQSMPGQDCGPVVNEDEIIID